MTATLTGQRTAGFDTSVDRFHAHLRKRLEQYYPDIDASAAEVRLVHHAKRHHSQLLKFEASDGQVSHHVIYKIPFCLQSAELSKHPAEQRPRLFSDIDPLTNGLREFHALESVEAHFQQLNDSRFGVIRMLDLLEQPYVEVMDFCPDGDLKSLLKKATRFHTGDHNRIATAIRNSGAWLRELHSLTDLQHTQTRHRHREDFIGVLKRLIDGLIQKIGRRCYFEGLYRQLLRLVEVHLPESVPSAVVHGDFAPRNILVGEGGRVTIFDLQRRWRAPLYEDLAYLLMSLKTPGPQVRSQGLLFSRSQMSAWEAELLNGYFETHSREHCAAIRLYEILLTLEWWSAINFRQATGTIPQRTSLALSNRYLFRYVPKLLSEFPTHVTAAKPAC